MTIYLAVNILEIEKLAQRFAGGDLYDALGSFGDVVLTTVALGLVLVLARFLYRRQIFLRV